MIQMNLVATMIQMNPVRTKATTTSKLTTNFLVSEWIVRDLTSIPNVKTFANLLIFTFFALFANTIQGKFAYTFICSRFMTVYLNCLHSLAFRFMSSRSDQLLTRLSPRLLNSQQGYHQGY